VRATIKVRDAELKSMEGADVMLFLTEAGKANGPLKAVYDRVTQCYLAELSAPAAGAYTVSAVAALKGKALGDDRQLLVCEAGDREMADLRAKPELMASLACVSGGRA